jgi:hypothetical protein
MESIRIYALTENTVSIILSPAKHIPLMNLWYVNRLLRKDCLLTPLFHKSSNWP